jgi:hypothetical protein
MSDNHFREAIRRYVWRAIHDTVKHLLTVDRAKWDEIVAEAWLNEPAAETNDPTFRAEMRDLFVSECIKSATFRAKAAAVDAARAAPRKPFTDCHADCVLLEVRHDEFEEMHVIQCPRAVREVLGRHLDRDRRGM